MFRRREYTWGESVAALVLMALVVLIAVVYFGAKEEDVDNQINQCLRAGGTPIVVGHQYTTEFKACQMP